MLRASPQSGSEELQTRQQFDPEEENSLLLATEDVLDKSAVVVENGLVVVPTPPKSNILQCSLCPVCGEAFLESDLDFHLKSHEIVKRQQIVKDELTPMSLTEEKLHSRELSGYATLHRHNLTANHQRRNNLDYKYQCDECGSGFYSRNLYQEHLSLHEKPFQCDICQATFRYRQGLRLHTKLHQPDYVPPQKKHCCEICNKRFCRRQVLLAHKRTHGGSESLNQNEYVCHICGKCVSSKTYLAVHVRKHTGEKPHVCDLCGKGFISQNYLSVHRRTHTGERPHKCNHCDKSFTQRTTLVVHERSHTGDRPYPCTCCHKSFASKTMLNSHLKTHAKQNARAQLEQRTHIHLQQQNLLVTTEQQQQILEQETRQELAIIEPDSNTIVLVPT